MTKTLKYNFTADLIRAIAIIFVVIVHVCADFLSKSTAFNSFDWWTINIIQTATKIAVPLFIMLSGQLILEPDKNYPLKAFYQRRLSRIGVSILFWPFFYYFSLLFFKHLSFEFLKFLNDYVFLNMFYHLYFLYIILGLYLIAPFLKKMLDTSSKGEKRVFITFSFVFSVLITVLVYALPTRINYWSVLTVFIPFISYFVAGDYLRNVKLTKDQLTGGVLAFVAVLIMTAIAKYFSYTQGNTLLIRYFDDVLSLGVISMSLIGYVILQNVTNFTTSLSVGKSLKFFQSVAAASFGIYIIHPLFIYLYNVAFALPALAGIKQSAPILLLMIFEVVLIGTVSYICVIIAKKIPLVRQLFG